MTDLWHVSAEGATKTTDRTTPYELIHERLRRECDLALNLAHQTQSRSQIVASTLALIVTAVGIAAAANQDLIQTVDENGLVPHVIVMLAGFGLALAASLAASWPLAIGFTRPEVVRQMFETDGLTARVPVDVAAEVFAPLRRKYDATEVAIYEGILKGNRFRGWCLVAALVLILVAVATATWISIDIAVNWNT